MGESGASWYHQNLTNEESLLVNNTKVVAAKQGWNFVNKNTKDHIRKLKDFHSTFKMCPVSHQKYPAVDYWGWTPLTSLTPPGSSPPCCSDCSAWRMRLLSKIHKITRLTQLTWGYYQHYWNDSVISGLVERIFACRYFNFIVQNYICFPQSITHLSRISSTLRVLLHIIPYSYSRQFILQ